MNKKPASVLKKLEQMITQHHKIYLSSISIAELQYGVYHSQSIERNRIALVEFLAPFEILDFNDMDAEVFGKIRSDLKKQGKIIGPYDMLIAAQALSRKLILVTNNIDEFRRIQSLKIEDWTK
jgi:tRNA(fMet)-specific endonuclease VapC